MMIVLTIARTTSAAEVVDTRAHERLDQALERVHATPAQQQAAETRLDAALQEFHALRQRALGVREDVVDALFGASVDRGALESARLELLSVLDEGSALWFDLAADMAEIFTPAQRAELLTLRNERLRDRVWAWWSGSAE